MLRILVISGNDEADYWKGQFNKETIGNFDLRIVHEFHDNVSADLYILDFSGHDQPKEMLLGLSPQLIGKNIVIVTDQKDADLAIEAIKLGAIGFLVKPFNPEEFKPIETRLIEIAKKKENEKQSAKIITLLSYKGGTGVSTTAVNLGYSISAAYGKRTLLIDAAGFSNHLTVLLNTPPKCTLVDISQQDEELDANYLEDAIKMITPSLGVVGGLINTDDIGLINIQAINKMIDLVRESFDYIIVDTPTHSIDELTMTFIQNADELIVLTTFDLLTVKDNRFFIQALKEIGVDDSKIKVVINRQDWFIGSLEPELVQKQLAHDIYFALPNDWNVCVEAANYGRPILDFAPDSPLAGAFKTLAGGITGLQQIEDLSGAPNHPAGNGEDMDDKKGLFNWFPSEKE